MLVENSHTPDALTEAFATVDGLMATGKYARSLSVMLPFVQSGELDAGLLDRTADCFFEMRDYDNAVNVMRHITENAPDDTSAWGKLGLMLQTKGDLLGAEQAFEEVLKRDPNSIPALTALNGIETFAVDSLYAQRMISLSERENLDSKHRALIHYALAQIAHAAGEVDAAFTLFQSARQEVAGPFAPAIFDEMVAEQEQMFEPRPASEDASLLPKLVFVGGMPMAGTGLVDRIMAQHPGVFSVGENTALSRTHGAIRMHLAKTGRPCNYWDWLEQLSAEEIDIFRQYYLERALGGQVAGGKTIVDAHPLGCLEFGLAQFLFPEAKFVFMSRHPMETALANIASNVLNGNALASRPEWIAQVMRTVYSSATNYAAKLGDTMRLQSYEALVQNSEREISLLLEHAGLEFNAACLKPNALCDVDNIATMLGQEELSTETQNQWQPYEAQLKPVFDELGGERWVSAWETFDATLR
ncbi:Probable TPR domain protein [Tritonibacter mobilis]|jgi:tetratricopeptide (TPR) repeat protein|uniref:tetratricopeptide repeat-containing sulfotransferase family protein n=1 Tax=Tritonibacter TaxID=2083206 RepID=UPI0001B8AA8A|nr:MULTISPECIES: sulfotransferase [Tritonibacter]EEW58978.1 tetratricopeptide TPR_2 repeat protein [Ruegeria sp. TrichCH4B]MBW3242686.1 sulfotransferase [Epibacterium sp. DP7N7-1]NKX39722.1 tetratricopeptide repeat protein [Rhodobacteraceae bacterium R_SAG5]NKX73506.1 tetratricopeptide repeat protein [Rhodobacteraceae bacterium R_SAG3]PXW82226.1 tetratricopeptide repeat protein [Ruegeria sp. P4]